MGLFSRSKNRGRSDYKDGSKPVEATSQPLSETQEPTVASSATQRRPHSPQPHPQLTRSQEQMMVEQMKAKVSRARPGYQDDGILASPDRNLGYE